MFSVHQPALRDRAGRAYQPAQRMRICHVPLLILLFSLARPASARAASGTSPLQPSPLGQGMCQAQAFTDGSVQAQIAIVQTTCSEATTVLGPAADHAQGRPYSADGFSCKATLEGPGSQWASAWSGTFYAYSCAKGAAQAAFNWGRHYTYSGPGGGSGSGAATTSGTPTFSPAGHHLLPTALGKGMCQARSFADGSVQAQVAVYHTTCGEATTVLGPAADHAQGSPYGADGFNCKATVEGPGSQWAGAWSGTFYAYSCAKGTAQAAFNWGRHYTY